VGSVQQVTVTAELRWTSDDRSLLSTKDDFFFSLKTFEAAGVPAYHEVKHDYWDPRFTMSYMASENRMLYASASHGTRSGGINTSLPITADPFFEPEENWTYEVGAKTTWLNGRLQINAAAFVIDWTDAQFRQIVSNYLTTTANSEGLDINGFEVDFIYKSPPKPQDQKMTYLDLQSKSDLTNMSNLRKNDVFEQPKLN